MAGEDLVPMQPWFRGFSGDVVAVGTDRYKFSGIIKETGDNEVEITELPIRSWTQDFKEKLEDIIKAEKIPSFIKDYKDYNTHTKVHFVIQLDEKHAKKTLSEGLEEKFKRKILNESELASGYTFNYKMRYNFFLQVPLSKKGIQPNTLSFVVNDEVHINFGKQIVYNYFDQNRFFLGFAFQTNKTDNLQFGYMNLFQQLASGNQYKMINAARIFYFHNIDLRKK